MKKSFKLLGLSCAYESADTAVGYSFLCASDKEFRQPLWVYDGTEFAYIEKEEKEVRIDDFTQKSPLPFRVIMPQAFGCMKSILEYVLNTQDSKSSA